MAKEHGLKLMKVSNSELDSCIDALNMLHRLESALWHTSVIDQVVDKYIGNPELEGLIRSINSLKSVDENRSSFYHHLFNTIDLRHIVLALRTITENACDENEKSYQFKPGIREFIESCPEDKTLEEWCSHLLDLDKQRKENVNAKSCVYRDGIIMGKIYSTTTVEEMEKGGIPVLPEKEYLTPTVVPGMNSFSQMIYRQNAAKGFWDKPRNFGELLMLVTSELGEALEAHRKGQNADLATFASRMKEISESLNQSVFHSYDESQDYLDKIRVGEFQKHVKDTIEDEIADSIIRLLDLCGGYSIDIETHITEKLRYNQTRPKLHGKGY
jgi:NTP pyrophosphatase (non-canonical NTP hydrolase)